MAYPSRLSEKAKELALELGAEAIVIVAFVPNSAGNGWDTQHSGYMREDTGLDWGMVSEALAYTAEDIVTGPVIEEPEPS